MTIALQPETQSPRRSSRLKLIGLAALGLCGIGYAGFVATFFAIKAGLVSKGVGFALAGVFGIIGEGGLWVGAACLGLGLYTRRKEKFARLANSVRTLWKR